MSVFPWTCPFCNHDTTITDTYHFYRDDWCTLTNRHGPRRVDHQFIVCPNPECREFTLTILMYKRLESDPSYVKRVAIWPLIPPSNAKPFPSYIPVAILDDYKEACLIKDLSPKASATLARRCLQGMIRNFWHIKKKNLKLEIDALKGKVEAPIWKAIDTVRAMGNIGAHMEKNIDLIIDVEPKEAERLIRLIEMLLKEWYIARHEREKNLDAIIALKENKKPKPAQPAENNKALDVKDPVLE